MENQLEEQLSKLVAKSMELAEKTGEFVIDQAPDLLQEFYNWHIASSIFFVVFAIFIAVAGYHLPFIWLSKEEKSGSYYGENINYFGRYGEEGAIVGYVLFIISSLAAAMMFFENLYDLIFIMVAPKIYLIEYFIK